MTQKSNFISQCGWCSKFASFHKEDPKVIQLHLSDFVGDAGVSQERAWKDSIPFLQRETKEMLLEESAAREYEAILEYQLPLENRRADVVFLLDKAVVVIELKGKSFSSQADRDQAMAYARDLRCYHRDCEHREVVAVLVPTRKTDTVNELPGLFEVSPKELDSFLLGLARKHSRCGYGHITAKQFLDPEAYRPLPTLVQAARELFESREIREIWRAKAATDPAVRTISKITHEAAARRQRHLVLISGVPGAGKTLVGLQAAYSRELDDLAVEGPNGKPTTPGVFLSGNGPLVQVLQYKLRGAGGGGTTFVRSVLEYLNYYVPRKERIPTHHLLVFDEAQRAFDQQMVKKKHPKWQEADIVSEPDAFVRIAERVREWSVMVGLIGRGQEIHEGEEGGIGQWREAIDRSALRSEWQIHLPYNLYEHFNDAGLNVQICQELNLDTELRFHLTPKFHEFVQLILEGAQPQYLIPLSQELIRKGMRFLISDKLDEARDYLINRFANQPEARYGLLASSKDKTLLSHGVPNDFLSTQRVKLGQWYSNGRGEDHSCCNLNEAVTEFSAQGLELDMALLAWGTDFIRVGGYWNNSLARGYRRGAAVKDPYNLRKNAYRVLLTRGRDGVVVFIPQISEMHETWNYLTDCGFELLK
jgi:hypothetical protein